jgi:hypothetical protein
MSSIPVVTLVILSVLVAVLGLFVAGNFIMVATGLAGVFGAGLLEVLGGRRSRA